MTEAGLINKMLARATHLRTAAWTAGQRRRLEVEKVKVYESCSVAEQKVSWQQGNLVV